MKWLFLHSYNMSGERWKRLGLYDRETMFLSRLNKQLGAEFSSLGYGLPGEFSEQQHLDDLLIPVRRSLVLHLFDVGRFLHRERERLRCLDFVRSNQMSGAWMGLFIKLLYGPKFVLRTGFELHNFAVKKKSHPLKRLLIYILSFICYRTSDLIIVSSEADRLYIVRHFGINREKVCLRSNSINTEEFRVKIPFDERVDRVLFVGRNSPQKNIPFILEALGKLNLCCDLYSTDSSVESVLSKYNQDHRFCGSVANSRMAEIYNQYKFFVICSRFEGNPKVLLEAMACGCVIIYADAPGISEVMAKSPGNLLIDDLLKQNSNLANAFLVNEHLSATGSQNSRVINEQNQIDHLVDIEKCQIESMLLN